MEKDEEYMQFAIEQANIAYIKGEVPVGAIIVCNGEVISRGYNKRESLKNALSHAEMEAIDGACRYLGRWRLLDCDIYVTLEPCMMCKGAIINSRIRRLIYGAQDNKNVKGINLFEVSNNYKPEVVGGVRGEECREMLRRFFVELREKT